MMLRQTLSSALKTTSSTSAHLTNSLLPSFSRAFSSTPHSLFAMSTPSEEEYPVTASIRSTLEDLLKPESLEIINDSSKHAHHSAMRGVSSKETHFRVSVVSEAFAGKNTMQRHRLIYGALKKDFDQGLHALSLDTKTPAEIAAKAAK